MNAHLTHEEVLEWLEGNVYELSLGKDSDFKKDGIYGYITEVDNTLSLAALCSEEVLNAEEGDNLDSNSDVACLVLQEVQQYLCLSWKLLTIDC